jgi:hypothetical protein
MEVVASQIVTEEGDDYFDAVRSESTTQMPNWLLELLSKENGNPLDLAFQRSLIYRGLINSQHTHSSHSKVKQPQLNSIGLNNPAQNPASQCGDKFERSGSEIVPPDWQMAWLRLVIQKGLVEQRT